MIERSDLENIGFKRCTEGSGWSCEAWYLEEAEFFVFYGDEDLVFAFVDGRKSSICEMVKAIVTNMRKLWSDRVTEAIMGQDW